MIALLFDKKSLNNKNAQLALLGIRGAISKRKYSYSIYHDVDMLDTAEGERQPIIFFCNSEYRSRMIVDELQRKNYHPILVANRIKSDQNTVSSCVAINYEAACHTLTKSILNASPAPIAFLGYFGDSYPDKCRFRGFKTAAESLGAKYEAFENSGDLSLCIENFVRHSDEYKNIVCANDIAAIALIKKLKGLGRDLRKYNICGFGDSALARFSSPQLTTVELNYEQAGAAAVELYCALEKMKNAISLDLTIEAKIHVRASTPDLELSGSVFPAPPENASSFYGDALVSELDALDRMLSSADETDLNILFGLLEKKTYEQLCEENFIAPNTVKYRLKKLISTAGAQNKNELCELLLKYELLNRR